MASSSYSKGGWIPWGGEYAKRKMVIRGVSEDDEHVLMEDPSGRSYDCVYASARGPQRAMFRSSSSSSCGSTCDEGPGRKRARAPNERNVGIYTTIPPSDEIKYVDHRTDANELITATPFRISLNSIKTGDQFYEKVGAKIAMKDLELWFRFGPSDNPNQARADVIRILILYDRSPTDQSGKGVFPDKETVILSYRSDGSTSTTSEDNINPTQTHRFLVLKDYKIFLANSDGSVLETSGAWVPTLIDRSAKTADRCFINLNGLTTYYRPHESPEPNPSVRQIVSGNLILFVFGLHPEDPGWNFHYTARLRYSDA